MLHLVRTNLKFSRERFGRAVIWLRDERHTYSEFRHYEQGNAASHTESALSSSWLGGGLRRRCRANDGLMSLMLRLCRRRPLLTLSRLLRSRRGSGLRSRWRWRRGLVVDMRRKMNTVLSELLRGGLLDHLPVS